MKISEPGWSKTICKIDGREHYLSILKERTIDIFFQIVKQQEISWREAETHCIDWNIQITSFIIITSFSSDNNANSRHYLKQQPVC